MKQGRVPSHTEIFLPIMYDASRYLLCCTPCITSNSRVFPYLNGIWETADQWGLNNWCSTICLYFSYNCELFHVGTWVGLGFYAMHHDPLVWNDPEV